MDDDRRRFGEKLVASQRYADHDPRRRDPDNPRIYVRVHLGEAEVHAMLDTGARWCIIPPPRGPAASADDPLVKLSMRKEDLHGRLTRASLTLVADSGLSFNIDATFFVPEPEALEDAEDGWRYPCFLGLEGALARLYFGLDASKSLIHFGPL